MPYKDPEVQRAYQRQWVASKRAAYLKDKCCVVCGSKESLEIDHIDREQKVSHRIWSWSLERREAELVKCQVLCHLEKSFAAGDMPTRKHGKTWMYRHPKIRCRCEPCTAANTADSRRYRQQRKLP